MKGDPMSHFDLQRVNMQGARAVFICNVRNINTGSIEAWRIDADTVCCGRLIESMLPPESETIVLAELAVGSNHEFLPIRLNTGQSLKTAEGSRRSRRSLTLLDDEAAAYGVFTRIRRWCSSMSDRARNYVAQLLGGSSVETTRASNTSNDGAGEDGEEESDVDDVAEYQRHPRYASGQLFVADVLTSLVANTYYNPSLVDLVSTMVSANVETRKVPPKWIGKPYRDYFNFLLWDENLLGLAIIRRARERHGNRMAKRQDGLAISAEHGVMEQNKAAGGRSDGENVRRFVFVYTAPWAKETVLLESDRIICFAQARLR